MTVSLTVTETRTRTMLFASEKVALDYLVLSKQIPRSSEASRVLDEHADGFPVGHVVTQWKPPELDELLETHPSARVEEKTTWLYQDSNYPTEWRA